MFTLTFKKETAGTFVYETDDPTAPSKTLYVSKAWLAFTQGWKPGDDAPETVKVSVEV